LEGIFVLFSEPFGAGVSERVIRNSVRGIFREEHGYGRVGGYIQRDVWV